MQRKENLIIWGFFSIVFIGAYMVLMQQSENIANNAYLISAFISLSLTFILDRALKSRAVKSEAKNSKGGSIDKKGSNEKKKSDKKLESITQKNKTLSKKGKKPNSSKKKK